eukprot:4491530-Pleurochrysis_carterae.AAC.1
MSAFPLYTPAACAVRRGAARRGADLRRQESTGMSSNVLESDSESEDASAAALTMYELLRQHSKS